MSAARYYVTVDLGSNSFFMQIFRRDGQRVLPIQRVKRKVRLAAGLDQHNQLSLEAMQRGWRCLAHFHQHLAHLPPHRTRIVATAALRLATNAAHFLRRAEKILGHRIEVISGEEEARLIWLGVTSTTRGPAQRLVIDIGGGSTELIVGQQRQPAALYSLSMGCVTWLNRFFHSGQLSAASFQQAEAAAQTLIQPVLPDLKRIGWQVCVGASGTVRTLQEIILAQGHASAITPSALQVIKQQVIACRQLDTLTIQGLKSEQIAVFPGGLAILIALFDALAIDQLQLAGGALREGLIYSMVPQTETVCFTP